MSIKTAGISKIGSRRQVVIPKAICDRVGLVEGDLVEISSNRGAVVLKPRSSTSSDDVLTPTQERMMRKAEAQIRRGHHVSLDQLEQSLERRTRARSRKAV